MNSAENLFNCRLPEIHAEIKVLRIKMSEEMSKTRTKDSEKKILILSHKIGMMEGYVKCSEFILSKMNG